MKIIATLFLLFSFMSSKAQQSWVEVSGGKGVFNEVDSIWTLYHYYENGRLLSIQFYEKDGNTQFGQKITYNPNGNLAYLISYEKGKLFGPFVQFFDNGKIKTKGNFYNYFKDGQWLEYNEEGQLVSWTEYNLTSEDSVSETLEYDKRYKGLEIEFALMPIKLENGFEESLPKKDVYGILIPEKRRIINVKN